MKKSQKPFISVIKLMILLLLFPMIGNAQDANLPKAKTGAFWEHVQVGGAFGLSIGNDYTDIIIAPSAIYNFDDHFAIGTGLQYSHLKQKDNYNSNLYGGSIIGLFNPIEEIQLSLEVEEVTILTFIQEAVITNKVFGIPVCLLVVVIDRIMSPLALD